MDAHAPNASHWGITRRTREALAHARAAVFDSVPSRWRGRVAATLPARVVPAEMRRDHFYHFFDEGDPFGIHAQSGSSGSSSEGRSRSVETVRSGAFWKLGCAVGSFTELLAPRAADILALDVSPAAVTQVARRLRDDPHVHVEAMTIPTEFPAGTFDLVVASDVLYYLPREDVLTLPREDRGCSRRRRCLCRAALCAEDGERTERRRNPRHPDCTHEANARTQRTTRVRAGAHLPGRSVREGQGNESAPARRSRTRSSPAGRRARQWTIRSPAPGMRA